MSESNVDETGDAGWASTTGATVLFSECTLGDPPRTEALRLDTREANGAHSAELFECLAVVGVDEVRGAQGVDEKSMLDIHHRHRHT